MSECYTCARSEEFAGPLKLVKGLPFCVRCERMWIQPEPPPPPRITAPSYTIAPLVCTARRFVVWAGSNPSKWCGDHHEANVPLCKLHNCTGIVCHC